MSVYRLKPTSALEQKLKEIAAKRNDTIEGILPSLVECGARRARYGLRRRSLNVLLAAIPTAFIVASVLLLVFMFADISHSTAIPHDILMRGLHWLRVFFDRMLPWPLTIIIGLWFLFGTPSAFTRLLDVFRLFRRFKIFGTEIELDEQTRSKIQAVASEISDAVKEYEERVNDEVERLVTRHQLDRTLAVFVDNAIIKKFTREKIGDDYRCTIHVPYPVQLRRLCQLLDYYPKGEGAFRTFSERFGIIGKVWRSEKRQVVGNLYKELKTTATPEQKIEVIMRDWGMERREAERAIERPSYLCLLLEHDGTKVGLVYMDSKLPHAFGTDGMTAPEKAAAEKVIDDIQKAANEQIAPKIAKIFDDLAPAGIRIFES